MITNNNRVYKIIIEMHSTLASLYIANLSLLRNQSGTYVPVLMFHSHGNTHKMLHLVKVVLQFSNIRYLHVWVLYPECGIMVFQGQSGSWGAFYRVHEFRQAFQFCTSCFSYEINGFIIVLIHYYYGQKIEIQLLIQNAYRPIDISNF